jgi:hypothetical protein
VIDPPVFLGEARCHDELVEVLRSRKEQLGLSNEWIDHHSGAASGTWDKILSSQRPLGRAALDRYLPILGCKIAVLADPSQEAKMRPRWEGRDTKQVRLAAKLGRALLKRARPVILSELGKRAAAARWARVSPESRSRLMREVAQARWGAHKHASAPVPQPETTAVP